MKILVAWSGGKDSQAALIWAVERFGSKNVTAVFCDTGWEHELTYKHVVYVTTFLGVELVTVRSKKYKGFVDLCKKKGRMPSSKSRFCTEELKMKPTVDYILSLQEHVIVIQGIRAQESESRSLMSAQCRYFRYYFEPIATNKTRLDALIRREKKLAETGKFLNLSDRKKIEVLEEKVKNGVMDPKYHNYRKKEVIEFCSKYADDVIRPHFDKDSLYVLNYIIDHGQVPNPLYFMGSARVGCYPCIMCNKKEIKEVLKSPEYVDRIRNAEQEVGSTFFRPDYVPKKYRRSRDKKGNEIVFIDDVVDYMNDKAATLDMFKEMEEEENQDRRCMSFYGICE